MLQCARVIENRPDTPRHKKVPNQVWDDHYSHFKSGWEFQITTSIFRLDIQQQRNCAVCKKHWGHSTTTWTIFFQFWPPNPIKLTIVDILHTTYPLFTWPNVDFQLTTNLPLLFHVVIEWPPIVFVNLYVSPRPDKAWVIIEQNIAVLLKQSFDTLTKFSTKQNFNYEKNIASLIPSFRVLLGRH